MKSPGDVNVAVLFGVAKTGLCSFDSLDPSSPKDWTEEELRFLELKFFNDMNDLGLDNDLGFFDGDLSDFPNVKPRLRDLLLLEREEESSFSESSRVDRPLSLVVDFMVI